MSEETEEICIQRFLEWHNEQYKIHYVHQRAEAYFPQLEGGLRWEFVAYEHDNPKRWIGIEVKELGAREITIRFQFWRGLCRELTQDLARKKIQGEFSIRPPVFELKPEERPKFREAFLDVLCQKSPNMKVNEEIDIGSDIAGCFGNWPKEKSDVDEWDKYGTYRPSKLMISKSSDKGCEVYVSMMSTGGHNVSEKSEEAFDEVFKLRNGSIRANEQLKLAKERGAMVTNLLLACISAIDEELIKNKLKSLDCRLISDIDCVYLVYMGRDRVVKICPN
jgi:hypothetical protein